MTALSPDSSQAEQRATELFVRQCDRIYRQTDRLLASLIVFQYIAGIITALVISPRSWEGITSATHVHVWAAVILGGMIASLPVYLAVVHPGQILTRHVIGVGQMLFGALLIHLTGGHLPQTISFDDSIENQ